MNFKAKFKIWDISALFMGVASLAAGILLAVAHILQMPVVKFYAEITLLTFLPVVIIYLWTEKVIEWMAIDSRTLEAIALTVRVISIAMFIVFAGSKIVSMYKDIPYAITSNYSFVEGKPVRALTQSGRGSRMYLAVNGVRFNVGEKKLGNIHRNSSCSITYLPNSKYVININ